MTEQRWFLEEHLDRDRLRALAAPVLERVERAIEKDRLPHAVLLAGPAGLGRELLAVEFAARLVSGAALPSDDFSSCERRVRAGNHPDVVLVQGEGRKHVIRIASIRKVVEEAPGRPFEGRCRVWIVNGVDSGTFPTEAANAFLKVLEEPPEHVRFILLAANLQAVLPTIRSRCSSLMLPGRVAASARTIGSAEIPPEIGAELEGETPVAELMAAAARGLSATMRGDLQSSVSLATLMGAQKNGLEITAAAALELAADASSGEFAESYAGLAAEILERERLVTTFALRPDRQLLASLLRWGTGTDSV